MDTIYMLLVVPGLFAALAGAILRQPEGALGFLGAGYLGRHLATGIRYVLGIQPSRSIGVFDPMLWMFAGAFLALLAVRGSRALGKRRGGKPWPLLSRG